MQKLEKFAQLGLSEQMLKSLAKKGFEEPTPIQEKMIPRILENNRDLVGQAQTGTGKTAAFGIPIIEMLDAGAKHIQAIILAPTRELAIQVSEELNALRGTKKLKVVPIYGGQSIQLQLKQLQRQVDIVVGTPGRILDHLRRGSLDIASVSFVVLDEADEMLNMGFIDDVRDILSATHEDRTTLLFSATMPREIVSVAKKYMKEYEVVSVAKERGGLDLTDQIYFEVAHRDRFEALCRIIDIESDFYGLIFCRTKVDVDDVASRLVDRGYDADGLHGDISQAQREKILNKLKKKRINVLVSTDVAARGIDVDNLTHVINYAIPQNPDSYVHRIGRTGRAGNQGTAITFITPEEYRKLMFIQRAANAEIRKQKIPNVTDLIMIKRARIMGEIKELAGTEIPNDFMDMASELLGEHSPEEALSALLAQAFKDELNPGNYNEIRDVHPRIYGKTRLLISVGRQEHMTKRRLVEMIKKKARIEDSKIDNVQVFDSYSFITVPFQEAEQVLKVFQSENRGKRPFVKIAPKGGPGGSRSGGRSGSARPPRRRHRTDRHR